jgi:insulysin
MTLVRSFSILIFVSVFYLFNLYSQDKDKHYQIIEDKSDLTILNPLLKERKILKLRLANGIKAYIISDKKADKSAAALGVLVGSWDDPSQYPGMAHFCEHMLFKGSKKYPEEASYFKFIFDNGGSPNAFTAPDRTVYMFSINHSAFEEALDRLSHFLKDPLFDTSHIARELYAVDQEHSKNIENDPRRIYMISKEIGNPNHPNAKFSTGNSKTLGSIPPSELRKWFETNYSSNQMTLCVYSNLDLDELVKMIVEKFTPIPNIGKDSLNVKEKLFSQENLGKIVYIKPISDIQILDLEWELNSKFSSDETKSCELIAYTLKRGQKYSLLENLKNRHLAEDLDVNFEKIGSKNSVFSIQIKLTDLGIQQFSDVIVLTLEAINNLKKTNIPYYLFHEMQSMAKLNYQYQSHIDAFDFVSNHATNLLDEDISTYPKKTLIATTYSSDNILEILKSLDFENCQFYLTADPEKTKVELDRKEKWVQAEYSIKDLNKSLKNNLAKRTTNSNIKLPEPNSFIPTNLQIVNVKENLTNKINPAKIVSDDFGTIYYLKDDLYQLPQISWNIQINDKVLDGKLKAEILKDLYLKALNEKLTSTIFSAKGAGLSPNIYSDPYHIKIDISGYSEKASYLLEEILKTIKTLEVSKSDFDIYYSSLYKDYLNEQKILPIDQAINYLSHILLLTNFTSTEKLAQLKEISFKDFNDFKNEIFKCTYIEGFLAGNLTLKEAESVWLDIKDILSQTPFLPKDHYKKQIFIISNTQGPYLIHKTTPSLGNGIILAIDENDFSFKNRASQNILSQVLKEAFFTALRSEQKTAYIALSFDAEIERRLFQFFSVQSNSHGVNDLLSRFEIFIENYLNNLSANIPQDRFENVKNNIIETLKNPYKNLFEMGKTLSNLAFEYNADFLWFEKRIEALKSLTYDDFLSFTKTYLSKDNRKRLAVLFEGQIDNDFKYKKLDETDYSKIGLYQSQTSN